MWKTVLLGGLASWMMMSFGCEVADPFERSNHDLIVEEEGMRSIAAPHTLDLLKDPEPPIRRRAARALGRIRHESFVFPLLTALDAERDPETIVEILFALGQIGASTTADAMTRYYEHHDPFVRAAAVEAASKLGEELLTATLLPRLSDVNENVRAQAAIAMWRLGDRENGPTRKLSQQLYAKRTLTLAKLSKDPNPEVRYRALFALAGIADELGRSALSEALRDEDARCRLFAVRGLRRLALSDEAVAQLIGMLRDRDLRVGVEALKGMRSALTAARTMESAEVTLETAPVIEAAKAILVGDQKHESFHVRAEAADVLANGPEGDEATTSALEIALADESRTVQTRALRALAAYAPEQAVTHVKEFAEEAHYLKRQEAAKASADLSKEDGHPILEALLEDGDVRVQTVALEVLGEVEFDRNEARKALLDALGKRDVALRATAAKSLESYRHRSDVEALQRAYDDSAGSEFIEARQQIVRSLTKIGDQEEVKEILPLALKDEAYAVRLEAKVLLDEMTGRSYEVLPPHLDPPYTLKAGTDYATGEPDPVVAIKTSKGTIAIRLLRDAAPQHVKAFLERMEEGKHDGTPFHRVVSNWVVQGLDPRKDGWGTGGLLLPDEINRVPYERGTVGMPNAGPDTGGCQLFITLLPAPRLDGRYTAFGEVVAGDDVLDRLEIGDEIEWVRDAAESAPSP